MKKILVVGGTGMLGFPVVKRLLADGYKVRVLSRNIGRAQTKFPDEIEIFEGNIEDKTSLRKALKGCFGVHINLNGGPDFEDYDRIEHRGTKNVIDAMIETGVKKVSYLSGLYTRDGDDVSAPSVKAKFKAEQVIIKSGLNYTIFRATWFMESLPLFVQGNKAVLPGNQPLELSWLSAEEYARMVSECFRNKVTDYKIFDVYGPEKFTMKDALKIYLEIVLPGTKIKKMPIWFIKILGIILRKPGLKTFSVFMDFASKNGETGNSSEADKIFGKPKITVRQWSEERNKIILDK